MTISRKDVEHVARLSRLALSDEEKEKYTAQMASILTYIQKLNELNTDHVPPTTHVLPVANVWRDDRPAGADLGTPEAVLNNAPDREGPFFKVRKVIE